MFHVKLVYIALSPSLMPKVGLEPTRPCEHTPLKRACLPISPLRQLPNYITPELSFMRAGRIELPFLPWQGNVLPLNYARNFS